MQFWGCHFSPWKQLPASMESGSVPSLSMDLCNPEIWYRAPKHGAGLKGSLGGSSYFFHYETIPTFFSGLPRPLSRMHFFNSVMQACCHWVAGLKEISLVKLSAVGGSLGERQAHLGSCLCIFMVSDAKTHHLALTSLLLLLLLLNHFSRVRLCVTP